MFFPLYFNVYAGIRDIDERLGLGLFDVPLGSFDLVAGLARDWGSRLVDLGPVGHLNPASGFGEWPMA